MVNNHPKRRAQHVEPRARACADDDKGSVKGLAALVRQAGSGGLRHSPLAHRHMNRACVHADPPTPTPPHTHHPPPTPIQGRLPGRSLSSLSTLALWKLRWSCGHATGGRNVTGSTDSNSRQTPSIIVSCSECYRAASALSRCSGMRVRSWGACSTREPRTFQRGDSGHARAFAPCTHPREVLRPLCSVAAMMVQCWFGTTAQRLQQCLGMARVLRERWLRGWEAW